MITLDKPLDVDTNEWALNDEEALALEARGDFFTAAFLHSENISWTRRHANALSNYLEKCLLPEFDGSPLYPFCTDIWLQGEPILSQSYMGIGIRSGLAGECMEKAANPAERNAYRKAKLLCDSFPGTCGCTHSILHYGRALTEGLDSYKKRIESHLTEPDKADFYESLNILVDGIEVYIARLADYLKGLSFDDPEKELNRKRLEEVYRNRLVMHPANSFFEAMVGTIFLYCLDNNDNLGRFDQFMWPFYTKDIDTGITTRDEVLELVTQLWIHVDKTNSYNVALAGTKPNGEEASNDLTIICMEAAKGRRRPNLALRLRKDTPERVWDAAIDTISTGTGLPALYCEENYNRAIDLAQLNLPEEDKHEFAFGGCTEFMIHGRSNVGSVESDYQVLKLFLETLHKHLANCNTFDEFLATFESDIRENVYEATEMLNRSQETRSKWFPALVRTLLIDDCIDNGKLYYNGGARYNWSIINLIGLNNIIDSLMAIKKGVFEERSISAETLINALKANFSGYEDVLAKLKRYPKHGNDDPEVNELAKHVSSFLFKEWKRYATWRGGKYLCSILMFVTYAYYGSIVDASPDGRLDGEPVGDSTGPVQGRDRNGPTAMLRSTASLDQVHAPGTLVVNIRVAKELVNTPAGRTKLKALIRSYFDLGGLQLQVNVIDQAVLRDAMAHPEKYGDLIIRIGGYSEYWNNLGPDLQKTVLERTEHH
ncbi:MAG: pyruvate formate lyase family protein [bacterium]